MPQGKFCLRGFNPPHPKKNRHLERKKEEEEEEDHTEMRLQKLFFERRGRMKVKGGGV